MTMENIKKLIEMRKQVKDEIDHLPRGNQLQNQLRMYYWPLRMNSLGKKAKNNETKEDVLKKSIESVKNEYPDFTPQFDEKFFILKVKK